MNPWLTPAPYQGASNVSAFDKNTISACIYGNQTVTDGQKVQLRLLERMRVGDIIIPANVVVTGSARITGERLGISITSIEYAGSIYPVKLSVYDTDGQQGIFIPCSMELNAAKEVAANMGTSMGSSINISSDAKAQLASDLGKGLIQGTSQYIAKKMRTVKVVDLGSANIIAGKADGAENVIRVKAAKRGFKGETNMSVITEDGAYYSFNVKYAREPRILNVEMADFIHDGEAVNRPNNSMNIYLKELGSESPVLVRLVMKSIWKENKRRVKHIGSKSFGIQFLLKGIYTHNGLLYFHTEIKNTSNVPFDVDYIIWKIVDKKVAKRTAIQEQVIQPLRTQNFVMNIDGNSNERTVWTMDKFTMPDDKCLVVELAEKNGGRHQSFVIENTDLVRARVISELKVSNQ